MVSPYLEADCVRRGRWTALRLSTPQSHFNMYSLYTVTQITVLHFYTK
jgi:hypothetical protein